MARSMEATEWGLGVPEEAALKRKPDSRNRRVHFS